MTAFRQAFSAEIARLAGDRFDLGLLLLMPAICLLLMGAMLSNGNPGELGVVVVDQDRSPDSRRVIGAIDAVESLRVTAVTPDLPAAFAQVRREQAVAVVVLPSGLAAARAASAPPRVEMYYQTAFLSTGAAVSLRLQAAIGAELAAIVPPSAGIPGVALARLPLPGIELTVFGNPGVSLEWYLGLLIGPALLHLLVGVTTVASLGKALEHGSLRAWTKQGGAPGPALLGRLSPHVAIGTLWLGVWLCWLMLGQGYRFGGSVALVMVGGLLLFGATAAISALLVTLLGEVSTALSASVIYAGSALAYSGASLPLNGGALPARLWSALLPLTHYLALQMDQTTGVLIGVWLRQALVLVLTVVMAGSIAVLRLRGAGRPAAA